MICYFLCDLLYKSLWVLDWGVYQRKQINDVTLDLLNWLKHPFCIFGHFRDKQWKCSLQQCWPSLGFFCLVLAGDQPRTVSHPGSSVVAVALWLWGYGGCLGCVCFIGGSLFWSRTDVNFCFCGGFSQEYPIKMVTETAEPLKSHFFSFSPFRPFVYDKL